jgi:predicted Zn finger-like uncharacterized protein
MTIHCPHCLTGYELPRNLMGEHGSRVRCPACQGVFVVLPEGEAESAMAGAPSGPLHEPLPEAGSHAAAGATAGAARPGPAAEAPDYNPALVAGAVLDVMVDFLGASLTRSRERGTVLSDHGPAIVAVWEEYRRRAGEGAPADEFRQALKRRVGIDLTPRA